MEKEWIKDSHIEGHGETSKGEGGKKKSSHKKKVIIHNVLKQAKAR